jgi:hypothetical protein
MSDNFESNIQDKKGNDRSDDNENELDAESGEVEGNTDLEKDMWGDEDEENKEQVLDESEVKGRLRKMRLKNLPAKDDQKDKVDQEKRKRKEEDCRLDLIWVSLDFI